MAYHVPYVRRIVRIVIVGPWLLLLAVAGTEGYDTGQNYQDSTKVEHDFDVGLVHYKLRFNYELISSAKCA